MEGWQGGRQEKVYICCSIHLGLLKKHCDRGQGLRLLSLNAHTCSAGSPSAG